MATQIILSQYFMSHSPGSEYNNPKSAQSFLCHKTKLLLKKLTHDEQVFQRLAQLVEFWFLWLGEAPDDMWSPPILKERKKLRSYSEIGMADQESFKLGLTRKVDKTKLTKDEPRGRTATVRTEINTPEQIYLYQCMEYGQQTESHRAAMT